MNTRRRRSAARVAGVVLGLVLVSSLIPSTPADAAVVLTVTPATGLAGGQLVQVTATGLDPGNSVDVWQCLPPWGCFYAVRMDVVADASGNLATEVVVHRTLSAYGAVPATSCEAQCSLAIGPIGMEGTYVSQPITFDPLAPPVPFSISATPDRGLVDGQVVQVTATSGSFNPGDTVRFRQCYDFRFWLLPCGPELGSTTADATGAFTATVPVYVGFDTTNGPVTCRGIGEFDCSLVAEGVLYNRLFLPITFGADLTTVTSAAPTTTAAQAVAVTPAFTG